MVNAFLLGVFTVFLMMTVAWFIHYQRKNATVVDAAWGLGFILLLLVYVHQGAGWTTRNIFLFFMVGCWGVRIIYFILQRMIREQKEDKRYAKLRKKYGKEAPYRFFLVFQFQALLQLILALPLLVISFNAKAGLSFLEVWGLMIWMVAFVGEALADYQLEAFKKDSDHKGKVCQKGLWYYSRHPNYFFEILIWISFYIFALSSAGGWLTICSPVLMVYLICKVTGIPLAEEQSLISRGDAYREYQQTTSVLIPKPRKKVS